MTAKRLLIYLSSPPVLSASWVAWDESNVVQSVVLEGNIADLSVYAHGYDTTVVLPGQDVLLTEATLPKMNRQRLLQALPFALEEQLIADVQDLHFAVGEYQADGTLPVAIITRQLMETYIEALKKVGILANLMLPATLALPFLPHQWQVCLLKDICLIRTGKYQGFACDAENIDAFLTLQLAASPQKPESLQVYHFLNQEIPYLSDRVIHEVVYTNKNALESIGDWLKDNTSINLLQGSYVSRASSSLTKKIWLASGFIAASWIVFLFFSQVISYFILEHSIKKTELAINAIYKKHFPASTSIVAPRERLQEKLKKVSSHTNSVLSLLSMIGSSLHQSPVIRVKQFDFHENNASLSMMAPSFNALDQFVQSLKQQGLHVKQQSADMTETDVKANLMINTGVA